jgi:SpoVK/Ycf46/Vps4 family AAA+-type ATPase
MSQTPTPRTISEELHLLVASRASLVFVRTSEERRLETILRRVADTAFSLPVPLFVWSLTEGLREGDEAVFGTEEPLTALDTIINYGQHALFLLLDLSLEDPRVIRRLRDAHRQLEGTAKTILLCGPELALPPTLQKQVHVLDLPIPDSATLGALFDEVCERNPEVTVELGKEREAFLRGGLGLTEDEARAAFAKLLVGRQHLGPEAIIELFDEKRGVVRKEGILEYVQSDVNLDDIGGLANLKDWLRLRQQQFSTEAQNYGLDLPRGLLLTGISGCGKSFAAKAIAATWRMPLVHLDMNRIYAGVAGTPERTLERAMRTAEAIAPVVLWIDEIETAIVGVQGQGQGGGQATRIFSSFLTWMQEKQQMVFVAATANEIDKLPPEMLRKGRFDEIFFVDLPDEGEREEILTVHLAKRNQDPAGLDVTGVAKSTEGWTGAELEQLVVSAMYLAFDWNRPVLDNDLYTCLGRTVPLSRTMLERIKQIKRWAATRAVQAGGKRE